MSAIIRFLLLLVCAVAQAGSWDPNIDESHYRNPIIFADYSDPDVVRVGKDFYMTASSFNAVPALPILHSTDLVNWRLINHAINRFADVAFDVPQHGNGVWAPAIRYHDEMFYIYYGDPDRGIYMVRARDPRGVWESPVLVMAGRGLIDPAPFWDDDGKAYLVHAFAKSRAGFNSVLHIAPMDPDGTRLVGESREVFDGRARHPTIEGPKLYRKDGWYYIFAPAGGVAEGWQTVLRSRGVFGPYEDRIVLAEGNSGVNGPHQGAWIELESGEDWFVHFQEYRAWGRIVHLQPMRWAEDWPIIGEDSDGDGVGDPVDGFKKPDVGVVSAAAVPQTSDTFDAPRLGLQWQWHANSQPGWYSLTDVVGALRLFARPLPDGAANFWPVPNLLLQKLPAPEFSATVRLSLFASEPGVMSGLIVMGRDYAFVALRKTDSGFEVVQVRCIDADAGLAGEVLARVDIVDRNTAVLRADVNAAALVRFSYSVDGQEFTAIGDPFEAKQGRWVGARIGLFAVRPDGSHAGGHADIDEFTIG